MKSSKINKRTVTWYMEAKKKENRKEIAKRKKS